MSEEEKFESIVQEIKEIYLYLTQGEPTPDDEIMAREKLIEKIQTLKTLNTVQAESNMSLFEDSLNKLDSWDTLELWFVESELPEFIRKIINITDEVPKFQLHIEEIKKSQTSRIHEDLESASIDIDEIVGKVSEKFKDEINGLKHEINGLKIELEKKDETLKQVSRMKVVKKITPKKDVKLPPPKIKIPVFKKPEKPPQIKVPTKPEEKIPIEQREVKSMQQVQLKIEEELDNLKKPFIEKETIAEKEIIPKSEDLNSIPKFQEPEIFSALTKDSEQILDVIEESDKPVSKMISELPEKSESISKILSESEKPTPLPKTPSFTAMPEKPKKSSVISEIIEIDFSEEEKDVPFAIKKPKFTEKPKDVEKSDIVQKPRVKSVSVEEVETESIRSTGTDLFNVFSSVGDKSKEKIPFQNETSEFLPEKEKKKKKKEAKQMSVKSGAKPFVEFGESKPEEPIFDESEEYNIEDLPKDKDSLYQELIALEGKRYSLEKNFNEIEKVYNMGSINDSEYQKQSEDLRGKLDSITSRINNIRRVISSL